MIPQEQALPLLLEQLDMARAEAASLRAKLQKAHGALLVLRHPGDVGKPRATWRCNPNALRDLGDLYNPAELLEATRPSGHEGLSVLAELQDLRLRLQPATHCPSCTWPLDDLDGPGCEQPQRHGK